MAGIGESERSVWCDASAETGDKAAVGGRGELRVQPFEDLAWRVSFLGERAERAEDQCAGHGGPESFAADVADDDQSGSSGLRQHLVEIAADLSGGQVGGGQPASGHGWERERHEALLDFARGSQFGAKLLAGAPAGNCAIHQCRCDGETGNR
jgi:hypothetical protein